MSSLRPLLKRPLSAFLTLLVWSLWIAPLILLASPAAAQSQPDLAEDPQVLIVPVHGVVGVTTVALVRRGLREARDLGVGWIVLDIDTPGGRVDSMKEAESMLAGVRDSGVRTIAYVRHQALSAGAYLALTCAETYLAPGATLGAITPVLAAPGGGIQQIPEDDARRKAYSAFRADVRSLCEQRGMSGDTLILAEAMVDPTMRVYDVVYEDEDGADVATIVDGEALAKLDARGVKIRSQTEVGTTPLTLTAAEALRFGFSSGTYDSVDEMLREGLGVAPDRAVRMDVSWSESAVDWLESMKPFLFLFGFILLLVEVKTPGFAVPGALGILLIGTGLVSSYLVGLAEWTEILLFLFGIIFIGLEIFVIPGTVISGVVGFLCVVFALILSQQSFVFPSTATQHEILESNLLNILQLLVLVVVGSILVWKVLPKVPVLNTVLLVPPSDPRTGDANASAKRVATVAGSLVGKLGVAATDLRPAGVMHIGDEPFDVVSDGGFIPRGTRVLVQELSGNRIVVVRSEPATGSESGETSVAWLVLMLAIGLALVVAEVFFPSGGILGILSAVAIISSVFLAFTESGQAMGFSFLTAAVIGVPVALTFAFKRLPHTSVGRALLLSGPNPDDVSGSASEPGIAALRGKSGVATSDLRPTGLARIDGVRVDVVTRGELIENGAAIRVVDVEGNRVVVTKHSTSPDSLN